MTTETPDPERDLRLARAGDRVALGRLLEKHHGQFLRCARERLENGLKGKIRISDVVQSAYLDVMKSLPALREGTERGFVAWVTRILENNIRDRRKYFAAEKRKTGHVDKADAFEQVVDASEFLPEERLSSEEHRAAVLAAIESLPESYRRALRLRVIDGLSSKQIAAILDRTDRATRVLLTRARAALLIELDERGKR